MLIVSIFLQRLLVHARCCEAEKRHSFVYVYHSLERLQITIKAIKCRWRFGTNRLHLLTRIPKEKWNDFNSFVRELMQTRRRVAFGLMKWKSWELKFPSNGLISLRSYHGEFSRRITSRFCPCRHIGTLFYELYLRCDKSCGSPTTERESRSVNYHRFIAGAWAPTPVHTPRLVCVPSSQSTFCPWGC